MVLLFAVNTTLLPVVLAQENVLLLISVFHSVLVGIRQPSPRAAVATSLSAGRLLVAVNIPEYEFEPLQ